MVGELGSDRDAPRLNITDVDRDKEPDNIFQEDEAGRLSHGQWWMSSGRMKDDLTMMKVPMLSSMVWVLKQLKVSGSAWERRQQLHFVQTGKRQYQMVHQFEGTDNEALFSSASAEIRHGATYKLIEIRTELRQLDAYLSNA